MATAYRAVDADTDKLITRVKCSWQRELVQCGVTIGAVFAYNDEPESEERPVKLGGYPCYAIIRTVSARDRAMGMPDAQIVIDEIVFQSLTPEQREALIDHELQHIEVRFDDEGVMKKDCLGRPKFGMRLHDWQIGGFRAVAERHRENSIEVLEAEKVRRSYGDTLWDAAYADRDPAPSR